MYSKKVLPGLRENTTRIGSYIHLSVYLSILTQIPIYTFSWMYIQNHPIWSRTMDKMLEEALENMDKRLEEIVEKNKSLYKEIGDAEEHMRHLQASLNKSLDLRDEITEDRDKLKKITEDIKSLPTLTQYLVRIAVRQYLVCPSMVELDKIHTFVKAELKDMYE